MRRRDRRGSHGSHDRWLVSYADFITLLFAFFVVLYAFAKQDQKKQAEVAESIDSAFTNLGLFPEAGRRPASEKAAGAGREAPPMRAVISEEVVSPARVRDDLERMQRELAEALSAQVAAHAVSIHMGRDGLVISLREAGFFVSGSAKARPEALPTLRRIADSLGKTSYDLRVEGHTDNLPIHNEEFDSNWELSSARATRIARSFIEMKALPAERVSAAGYAEFHPVASNETAEGRAENRRVDLVVRPRTRIDLSAGPAPATGPWRRIRDLP
jgi:chemotaxis protein MotB